MKRFLILVFVVAINAIAFVTYGLDKKKAHRGRRRIPESTLLFLAFIGGAIGAYFGMKVFHHKTRHRKFRILIPVFIVLQAALAAYAFFMFVLK